MKVFFDYAIFTLQRFGGVSNYIVNLVENFSDQVDPLIISLFYKNHYLKNSNFADKLIFYNRVGSLVKYVNRANKIYFDYKLKNKNPDIIHLTYFNEKNFYASKAKKMGLVDHVVEKNKLHKAACDLALKLTKSPVQRNKKKSILNFHLKILKLNRKT